MTKEELYQKLIFMTADEHQSYSRKQWEDDVTEALSLEGEEYCERLLQYAWSLGHNSGYYEAFEVADDVVSVIRGSRN